MHSNDLTGEARCPLCEAGQPDDVCYLCENTGTHQPSGPNSPTVVHNADVGPNNGKLVQRMVAESGVGEGFDELFADVDVPEADARDDLPPELKDRVCEGRSLGDCEEDYTHLRTDDLPNGTPADPDLSPEEAAALAEAVDEIGLEREVIERLAEAHEP